MASARYLSTIAFVFVLAAGWPARADFLLSAGKASSLLLNRTPPMFLTDPPAAGANPHATARAEIDGKVLRVILSWDDPTENSVAGTKRAAYRDDAIYKKPTGRTDLFGDAAAMMIPVEKGTRAPGIMMGDPSREVRIILWRAGTGVEALRGHGRGTVEKAKNAKNASGLSAVHGRNGSRRQVTFTVEEFNPELPVAFAIWEGGSGDRNGYKWYTPWYLVRP